MQDCYHNLIYYPKLSNNLSTTNPFPKAHKLYFLIKFPLLINELDVNKGGIDFPVLKKGFVIATATVSPDLKRHIRPCPSLTNRKIVNTSYIPLSKTN